MRGRHWCWFVGLIIPQIALAGDPFPIQTKPEEREVGFSVTVQKLTPTLVWCPPGTFVMGSPHSEKYRSEDEDQVQVTLTHGFWIGREEVTQQQWRAVMNTRPWREEKSVEGQDIKEGDLYPATCINWQDAMNFCVKLTEQERKAGRLTAEWKYSLPSEAQWEYACRAGTTTAYDFGDDAEKRSGPFVLNAYGPARTIDHYAWYNMNVMHTREVSEGLAEPHSQNVGGKKPNAWGIYDMHGNVGEWCLDGYGQPLPGGHDPVMNNNQAAKESRIIRGGSWRSRFQRSRSAARDGLTSTVRKDSQGFRIALVLAKP